MRPAFDPFLDCRVCRVCVSLGQGNWDMWYDPLAYFILGGRKDKKPE